VLLCIGLVLFLALRGSEWLWGRLADYIQPSSSTGKKDLVNVFVLIAAGVVGFLTALAAMLNVYMSRKLLRQQRELDEQRAQDEALQNYYERVGDLIKQGLLEKRNSSDPLPLLAQAQTRTVLRRADATRKGAVVKFLSTSRLIAGKNPILDLVRINLTETVLSGVDLSWANLLDANLTRADLSRASLSHAHLSGADLSGANLSSASLRYADLSGAKLRLAKNLIQEQVDQAIGSENTQLPNYIQQPEAWSESVEKQRCRLKEIDSRQATNWEA